MAEACLESLSLEVEAVFHNNNANNMKCVINSWLSADMRVTSRADEHACQHSMKE